MKGVKSKEEMKENFRKEILETYDSLKENQELKRGQRHLKSYLIESNIENVEKEFEKPSNSESLKTGEKDFFQFRVKKDEEEFNVFLEKLDERFYVLHSLGRSLKLGDFVEDRINPRFTGLDFIWMSNHFLEKKICEGKNRDFRRLSLSYEDKFKNALEKDDERVDRYGVNKLSARLWGKKPRTIENVLNSFRENDELEGSISLNDVGVRKYFKEKVLFDDINYKGKFKAHGESVEGHFKEIIDVKNEYRDILSLLEEKYRMRHEKKEIGVSLKGVPVTIHLKREIKDMEKFLSVLLSSKKPFRIWGVESKASENQYVCPARDMHTGHKINLEVSPSLIRVYLPEESCGNTIFRLYTNIQHYFDSQAKLVGESEDELF